MPTAPLVHKRFVEIGRVAYIGSGKEEGKLCTIVDVIDQQRALIEGPCTGVRRQAYNFKHLQLTNFVLNFAHSSPAKIVKAAWEKEDVNKKWSNTQWCRNLAKKKRRAELTDFERYKLRVAKFRRNRLIEREYLRLKKIGGVERPGTAEFKRAEKMMEKRLKNRGKKAADKIRQSIRLGGKQRKAIRREEFKAGVKKVRKTKKTVSKKEAVKPVKAVAKKTDKKKVVAKKAAAKK